MTWKFANVVISLLNDLKKSFACLLHFFSWFTSVTGLCADSCRKDWLNGFLHKITSQVWQQCSEWKQKEISKLMWTQLLQNVECPLINPQEKLSVAGLLVHKTTNQKQINFKEALCKILPVCNTSVWEWVVSAAAIFVTWQPKKRPWRRLEKDGSWLRIFRNWKKISVSYWCRVIRKSYFAQAGAPLTSSSHTWNWASIMKSNPNSWKL